MSSLSIQSVNKSYGVVSVLRDVSLTIQSGEFVVFVGPSGCGKSTLLRLIAGLEEITSGTVSIDGVTVNDTPPAQRGIAMVFQSYALYPHMTVRDNMAFGLKLTRMPKAEIASRVDFAAEMLQLTELLDRLPKQLSGGQRQRVAIGRAITRDPRIFLFDEPLSNLDAALRVATRIEIAKLKERMPNTTMIYVTHDQIEAMTLADRIVVMNKGRIEQIGTPLELYHNPANRFVAGFIGSPAMNFVDATVSMANGVAQVATRSGDAVAAPASATAELEGKPLVLGCRPEDVTIVTDGPALLRGTVMVVENLGELTIAYVDVGQEEPVIVKLPNTSRVARGETVALSAPTESLHLFDGEGQSVSHM